MATRGAVRRAQSLLALLPMVMLGIFSLMISIPTAVGALPADAAGPLVLAAALTAGMVLAVAAGGIRIQLQPATAPAWVRTLSLRECAAHTVFLRLRDPDARGRTRPRAPTEGPAAA